MLDYIIEKGDKQISKTKGEGDREDGRRIGGRETKDIVYMKSRENERF